MFNVQKIHLKIPHVIKQFLFPPSLIKSIDQTIFYHPLSQISVSRFCSCLWLPVTYRSYHMQAIQSCTGACFEMKFGESFLSLQLSEVKGNGLKFCSCKSNGQDRLVRRINALTRMTIFVHSHAHVRCQNMDTRWIKMLFPSRFVWLLLLLLTSWLPLSLPPSWGVSLWG